MTVNYRNSAGTDLDSLFYVANNNEGAIGFLESGGQDLGNRYPSGSLGYAVGYKNSSGSDIGYIRSNYPTTTLTLYVGKNLATYGYEQAYDGAREFGSVSTNLVGAYEILALTRKCICFIDTSLVGKTVYINNVTTGEVRCGVLENKLYVPDGGSKYCARYDYSVITLKYKGTYEFIIQIK